MRNQNLDGIVKVHTRNLFEHIISSLSINQKKELAALKIPLNIFIKKMNEIAGVASEINHPKLNCLMMELALYEIADPESEFFDANFVNEYIKNNIGDKND